MKFEVELSDNTVDELIVMVLKDQLHTARIDQSRLPENIIYNHEIEQALLKVLRHNLPADQWDFI